MKKQILFIFLALLITTVGFAQQGRGRGNQPRFQEGPRFETEALSVSGRLIVAHGSPAIKNGDTTYIVKGIQRLSGFVDGLKEGAQVTIEGKSAKIKRDDNIRVIIPAKLTLNGKEYDMSPLVSPMAFAQNLRNNNWNRGPGQPQPRQHYPNNPYPNGPRRQHWL